MASYRAALPAAPSKMALGSLLAVFGFLLATGSALAAIFWQFHYWYIPFTIGSCLLFDRLSWRFAGRSYLQLIQRGEWRPFVRFYSGAAVLALVIDVVFGRVLASAWVYPPWSGLANIAVPVLVHYPFGTLALYLMFQTVRGLLSTMCPGSPQLGRWYGQLSLPIFVVCLALPLLNYWLNSNRGQSELLFVVLLVATVALDGVRDLVNKSSMLRELLANGWRYAAAFAITIVWAVIVNEGPNTYAREWVYLIHPFGLPLWLLLILAWPFLLSATATVYETIGNPDPARGG